MCACLARKSSVGDVLAACSSSSAPEQKQLPASPKMIVVLNAALHSNTTVRHRADARKQFLQHGQVQKPWVGPARPTTASDVQPFMFRCCVAQACCHECSNMASHDLQGEYQLVVLCSRRSRPVKTLYKQLLLRICCHGGNRQQFAQDGCTACQCCPPYPPKSPALHS